MLPGHDLHRFGPPPEFFVQPLNDIGSTQRNPFLFRESEESETAIPGVL